VSRKQHEKQVARARAKRASTRHERQAARNRVIILVMAALLVLSLFVPALLGLVGGGSDDDPVDEPAAEAEEGSDPEADPATDEAPDAAADAATVGPCGPTPDDAPEVDSVVYDAPFELTIDESVTYVATIETTCGSIVIELDAANAPLTTNNFVNLAQDGYYDGIVFHRVIAGFVAQAGDPTGTGASPFPGYTVPDELDVAEAVFAEAGGGYPRGTVAMANAGADTNGSQFFIAQGDPTLLPGPNYSVFGRVIEGLEVVDAIVASPTDARDRPLEDVVIRSVTIGQG
jgi:cyclophilin family peptidyl-prolyl cis-trans isomerase